MRTGEVMRKLNHDSRFWVISTARLCDWHMGVGADEIVRAFDECSKLLKVQQASRLVLIVLVAYDIDSRCVSCEAVFALGTVFFVGAVFAPYDTNKIFSLTWSCQAGFAAVCSGLLLSIVTPPSICCTAFLHDR